jgi:hypothetical protein
MRRLIGGSIGTIALTLASATAFADVTPMCLSFGEGVATVMIEVPAKGSELPGTTLWCVSADDPRCSPVQHGDDPSVRALLELAKFAAPQEVAVAPPGHTPAVYAPLAEAVVPGGVVQRLERPPRS